MPNLVKVLTTPKIGSHATISAKGPLERSKRFASLPILITGPRLIKKHNTAEQAIPVMIKRFLLLVFIVKISTIYIIIIA